MVGSLPRPPPIGLTCASKGPACAGYVHRNTRGTQGPQASRRSPCLPGYDRGETPKDPAPRCVQSPRRRCRKVTLPTTRRVLYPPPRRTHTDTKNPGEPEFLGALRRKPSACLAVRRRLVAARAVLRQLETIRRVTTVLLGDVVALLALRAGQSDLGANVLRLACHGCFPRLVSSLMRPVGSKNW